MPDIGVGLGKQPTLARLAFSGGGGTATVFFNARDSITLRALQGSMIPGLRAQFPDDTPGSTQSTYVNFSGVHIVQIEPVTDEGAEATLHYDQVERASPLDTFTAKVARRTASFSINAAALPYPPE